MLLGFGHPRDNLGTGAEGVGLLGAAMGLGGLVVAPFTVKLASGGRLVTLFCASVGLTGISMASLALPRSIAPALVIAFIEGFAFITFEVAAVTLVQRAVDNSLLGRVMGLTDSVNTAAMLIGTVAVPPFVAWFGLGATLAGFGIALAVSATIALPAMRALDVTASRRALVLKPRADALATLALFTGASRATLETLAGAISEETITLDTIVMREFDAPDDLYIIRSGTFAVTAVGIAGNAPIEINTMTADDWFGEIGLVHQRPRTATVTATSDATLWRIPGNVFLDAVAGTPGTTGALGTTMATRLARTHALTR